MIYELFMLNNELDLLEIKLEELYDFVDKFIIIESTHTHTNLPKTLHYVENEKRFDKYKDKVIHLVCTFAETNLYNTQYEKYKTVKKIDDTWFREHYQRDFGIISNQINFNDDDIIIISDLDEIVNKHKLSKFIRETGIDKIYRIGMSLHYYKFNLHAQSPALWRHTYIGKYKHLKELDFLISYIRHDYKFSSPEYHEILIENMGWHFTHLMTAKDIVENKYKQYAHADELKHVSEEQMLQYMKNREAFGYKLVKYPISDLPETVIKYLRFVNYFEQTHP